MKTLAPGDRIKFTGKFLRSTGQVLGHAGMSKWTVRACDCSLCRAGYHVCTDQPSDRYPGMYTDEEWTTMPSLHWRHLAVGNVYKVGTVDVRNSP